MFFYRNKFVLNGRVLCHHVAVGYLLRGGVEEGATLTTTKVSLWDETPGIVHD
jgi:hypothetical protein